MLHECYKSNTNLINIKWLTFLQKQSNDIDEPHRTKNNLLCKKELGEIHLTPFTNNL